MTEKANLVEEWTTVLQGPPSAGMIVVTAQRGGSSGRRSPWRSSYSEARKRRAARASSSTRSPSTKPHIDHTRYHSEQELKDAGLQHLRAAIQVIGAKATPEEVEEYKQFVLHLADNVASAHREGGVEVSPAEKAAIDEIAAAMGAAAAQ